MIFFFIIIQIIGCFSLYFEPAVVIQLEEYTNLISVLKKNNNNLSFLRWKIDNNGSEVNHFNVIKFKKFNFGNTKIFQIKNINENDKKSIFYCRYKKLNANFVAVNSFENLNPKTFINSLSSDNINIEYVVNNMNLKKININFKKIFPIPECFVKIKNESFFPKNIQSKILDYLFLKVNLNTEIKKTNCSYEVEIFCTLLNQTFNIETKNDTCMYNTLGDSITNSTTTIIVLIILFLIFGIILLIFIYFKRKDPNERKEILYSLINKIKK